MSCPEIAIHKKSVSTPLFYSTNLEKAQQYLQHPILGKRQIEISKELLQIENKTALEILGKPDEEN